MKKLFLIAFLCIGFTTAIQAQTVTQDDAPGTTNVTGFIANFTFGTDTVLLAVDVPNLKAGLYYNPFLLTTLVKWHTGLYNSSYWGTLSYGGYNYLFEIVADNGSNKIVSYQITRS